MKNQRLAPEAQIKAALMDLNAGMTSSNSRALSSALERLEVLLAEHGSSLDPRLAHFLERRSYAKALAWLEGGATTVPPGGCSRGNDQ